MDQRFWAASLTRKPSRCDSPKGDESSWEGLQILAGLISCYQDCFEPAGVKCGVKAKEARGIDRLQGPLGDR
jgi:hypothetical protein